MSFSQGSVILQQKRSAGGPVTAGARNGTNIVSGYVELGGGTTYPFLHSTYIDTDGYLFQIGDLDVVANGSNFFIDDANQQIYFTIGGGTRLSLNKSTNTYKIGDITGTGNSTVLTVDDANSLISSSKNFTIGPKASPVLTLDATAGTYAGIVMEDAVGGLGYITADSALQLYGTTTYKNIILNDYAGGSGAMLTIGTSSGSALAAFNALISTTAKTILSNFIGCYDIQRTYAYSAPGGNNPHGYTDNTVCRLGGGGVAFNSFSSFVTFGNTAAQNLGHFASFQSVWTKDQSNTADIVYDFVAAVSSITGGTVSERFGLKVFDATTSGGGALTTQTGVLIPALSIATNNYGVISLTTKNGFGTATPTMMLQVAAGRFGKAKGADVASANDLTLGADGNLFHITGATTINAITTANWQAGSEITLIFDSTPTVKNNTAGGAGTAKMLLAGAADFSATANDVLKLCYDGTSWFEVCRSVN